MPAPHSAGTGAVVSDMLKTWSAERPGRVLLVAWSATFAGVTLRAVWLRRKAKAQAKAQAVSAAATATTATAAAPTAIAPRARPSPFKRVGRLAVPGWRSAPVGWCAVLSVGIGLRLVVSIQTSQEIGVLGSLLSKRDWPALYRRQLTYALIAIPAALTTALQKYAAQGVALAMRRHLTGALHRRYAEAGSLPLALAAEEADGSAQRGTADVAAYCNDASELFQVPPLCMHCMRAYACMRCMRACLLAHSALHARRAQAIFKPAVEVVLLSGKLASMMGTSQLLQCERLLRPSLPVPVRDYP